MIVCGIDPGGAHTGFCCIDAGGKVLAWRLIECDGDGARYFADLREAVSEIRLRYVWAPELWAVEGLVHPNPHLGLANVRGLMDTSRVIGWFDVWLGPSPTVEIRPNKHGTDPLDTYPAQLVGARESVGAGKMRHVRAAYDVAHAGIGQTLASSLA